MSSCECEEHITGLYEELTTLYLELKKLSAENNSIQRSLVDIKLLLMAKKQSLKRGASTSEGAHLVNMYINTPAHYLPIRKEMKDGTKAPTIDRFVFLRKWQN